MEVSVACVFMWSLMQSHQLADIACVTTVTTYLRTELPHLICSTVTCIYIMYALYIHMQYVACNVKSKQSNSIIISSHPVHLKWAYSYCISKEHPCTALDCVHCTQLSLPSCAQSYIYIRTSIKCPHSAMHFQKCQFCDCMQ